MFVHVCFSCAFSLRCYCFSLSTFGRLCLYCLVILALHGHFIKHLHISNSDVYIFRWELSKENEKKSLFLSTNVKPHYHRTNAARVYINHQQTKN